MDSIWLSRLPDKVQSLVRKIEQFADHEILVEVGSPSNFSDAPGVPGVEISESMAKIWLPHELSFSTEPVLHELLHVHRFWVERVPRVIQFAASGADRTLVENALEHLVIVPMEVEFGENPFPYWNSVFKARLNDFVNMPSGARRALSMLTYAQLRRVVDDSSLRDRWYEEIERAGHLQTARQFWTEVEPRIDDKRELLKYAIPALGIADDLVRIELIDVRARVKQTLILSEL